MRGPLESLICANPAKPVPKSASPIAFSPSTAAPPLVHAMFHSSPGRRTSAQLTVGKVFIILGVPQQREFALLFPAPIAIRSDSDRYPFGYWNKFSSGMNLGLKCDKKGAR